MVFLISIFNVKLSLILAKLKLELVEWLNCMLPHINLPLDASDEELRVCLSDGSVLCSILDKLCPGVCQVRWHLMAFFHYFSVLIYFFSVIICSHLLSLPLSFFLNIGFIN